MLVALHLITIYYWNNCLNNRSIHVPLQINIDSLSVRKINHEKYTFSRHFRVFWL